VYTARDREGRNLSGELDATNADNALITLQGKGFLVTSITVQTSEGIPKAARRRKLHNRVMLTDQILLCQQLGTMLNAGIPLLRCLEVMTKQLESKRLLLALFDCIRDVEGGSSFRDALAQHPKVFSPFWINVVETGEASGRLGESLEQLARYLERTRVLREKLVSALLYPTFLVVISVAVLAFFSLVIIPMFERLFASFDAKLPMMTSFVLNASKAIRKYCVLLALAGVGIGWLLKRYFSTPQGRWVLDKYSLQIPIIGRLLYDAQIARFASGLGTLLESGVPILFALEILERSADNKVFGQAYGIVKNEVREGKPMAVPLETTGLFPPMVVQMVQVGEEIGEMDTMLGRVAKYYEERINTLAERMGVMFEPVALVFVGVMVGFLVISLFLPLFNLATAIQ